MKVKHSRDITWVTRLLKSSPIRLFAEWLVKAGWQHRKFKALHYWPFGRGIHRWPVDSPCTWPVIREAYPWIAGCHKYVCDLLWFDTTRSQFSHITNHNYFTGTTASSQLLQSSSHNSEGYMAYFFTWVNDRCYYIKNKTKRNKPHISICYWIYLSQFWPPQ